jgi:hypothetical protein
MDNFFKFGISRSRIEIRNGVTSRMCYLSGFGATPGTTTITIMTIDIERFLLQWSGHEASYLRCRCYSKQSYSSFSFAIGYVLFTRTFLCSDILTSRKT